MIREKKTILLLLSWIAIVTVYAQRIPNELENLDYLITYGREAPSSRGDDDHVQTLFFSIPLDHASPIYIRVYDPDTGGTHDELYQTANTTSRYSVYGGKGALSDEDAQKVNPVGNYKSGSILASKTFRNDSKYDASWYTFGPFNPLQGERMEQIGSYIFKLIIEGIEGDDGNQYRCFLSESPSINRAVEGANVFAYEYTFKLPEAAGVSHIYPFIDPSTISVMQWNFDYDNIGEILIYSVAKNRHKANVSGNDMWAKSKHTISEAERNTTIDIQMKKNGKGKNAMSFYITNQYEQAIPFFTLPIGGPPKYKYDLKVLLKSSKTE